MDTCSISSPEKTNMSGKQTLKFILELIITLFIIALVFIGTKKVIMAWFGKDAIIISLLLGGMIGAVISFIVFGFCASNARFELEQTIQTLKDRLSDSYKNNAHLTRENNDIKLELSKISQTCEQVKKELTEANKTVSVYLDGNLRLANQLESLKVKCVGL